MSTIKKSFAPIIEFLEKNQDKKVKSVLEAVIAMASTKGRGASEAGQATHTFIKDTSGATVAMLCYYYKRWMPLVGPDAVEVGAKASAASGLSSMCKLGTSLWTKQQATAKKAVTQLLLDVEAGTLAPSDIGAAKERIEEVRKQIEPTNMGFLNEEDVRAYLAPYATLTADASADESVGKGTEAPTPTL